MDTNSSNETYGGHLSNQLPEMGLLNTLREQNAKVGAVTSALVHTTMELMAARALGRDESTFFQQLEVLIAVKAREEGTLREMLAAIGE